ncbi:ribosome silencing factor, partial [Verrucomicrobiota bacterium]
MSKAPEYVEKVVTFIEEKKASDVAVMDLREASDSIDYFVICTGTGAPHLKALQNGLERVFKNAGYRPYRKAGSADSGWVVLDYNNMMVHMFTQEMREHYDLEN